jgi:hypothetical protein
VLSSICVLLLAGCASIAPAQVGHMAGSIAGVMLIPGIGAPIGGLIGLLAGMAVQREVDRSTEGRERKELAERLGQHPGASEPAATPMTALVGPVRLWVDEVYQDGRLVPGHFETRQVPSG